MLIVIIFQSQNSSCTNIKFFFSFVFYDLKYLLLGENLSWLKQLILHNNLHQSLISSTQSYETPLTWRIELSKNVNGQKFYKIGFFSFSFHSRTTKPSRVKNKFCHSMWSQSYRGSLIIKKIKIFLNSIQFFDGGLLH